MSQTTPTDLRTETPPSPRPAEIKRPRSSTARWVWLILLLAAAAATYYFWPKIKALQSSDSTTPTTGKGKKGGAGITPVVAARAQKGSIGVYYSGLGAVTPIYTVTVKSRVDGELMRVNFKEGQLVQERRFAGRDRSSSVSGAIGSGARATGA